MKGFRSLGDVSVCFRPGLNVLVGKNNAGKSNIMKALNMLFGEKWPTYLDLSERDYFTSGTGIAKDILVAAWLEGSVPSIPEDIQAYYMPWPDGPAWDGPFPVSVPDGRKSRCSGTAIRDWLEQSKAAVLFLNIPRRADRRDRDFGLAIQDRQGSWKNISLTSELRDALITTALIPAFRDPDQQLRPTSYSWYGKLLRQLYDTRTPEQDKKVRDLQSALKSVTDEIFKLSAEDLRFFLSEVAFNNEVRFQIGSNLSEDIYKQVMLFVNDGMDAPYYEKGSGIQSAIVIGLFAYYCKTLHQGSSLLLVEEPELYLHPQGRRAIESRLAQFAGESTPERERQVILSTHSPEFVRSVDLPGIIRVYKAPDTEENQTMSVQIQPACSKDISERYRQIMCSKGIEMFFADHVILVEGGEEYLVPSLADLYYGKLGVLDTKNVSVVRVSGKTQFKVYVDILDGLRIGWTILADLDFLLDGLSSLQFVAQDPSFLRGLNKLKSSCERARRGHATSAAPVSGKSVKSAMNAGQRDWVALYRQVELVVRDLTSGTTVAPERLSHIRKFWDSLRDKIEGVLDIRELARESEQEALLDELLARARKMGVYMHPNGDLESCLTPEAMAIETSKDRRALCLAQRLRECQTYSEIRRWLADTTAIEGVFERVIGPAVFHASNRE